MAIIGEWFRRIRYLLQRSRFEEELRREMEAHRALLSEPRDFGNTLRLRDEARDAWGWRWLDDLLQDTRLGARMLLRAPGFTTAAIATLALGIGINIGMFRLVDALLLRPLYERPDGVVTINGRDASYPDYRNLRDATTDIFASLAATKIMFVGLDAGEGSRSTLALAVTADYFQIFGEPLTVGRSFTFEEERPGSRSRAAIVSHRFWTQHGADASVLTREIFVHGHPFTIVGVAPRGFTGATLPAPDIWLPLGADDTFVPRQTSGTPRPATGRVDVIGRLRDGVSRASGEAALAAVSERLTPASADVNADEPFELGRPLRFLILPDGNRGQYVTYALLLMLMPAIVLLVACLNLANLLLARGQGRRHEIAIRSSLGGTRGRLTRQMLGEGLLLACAGGAAGLLLSTWATQAIEASIQPVLPVALTLPAFDLDWRVLAATMGFSLLATLVFGGGPAWTLATRAAVADLRRQAGEEKWQQLRGIRVGNVLVIGQVALSLVLIGSGGLFLKSAISAARADPGFRLDGGLVAEIDPSLAGYDASQSRELHREVIRRLQQLPGVQAVTIGSRPPFSSSGDSRRVVPAGLADTRNQGIPAVFSVIGRDYARTLGLPMSGGRDFTEAEVLAGSSEAVAIIDDALAQRLWPGEDALGRLIEFAGTRQRGAEGPMRIVGIMPAVKHSLDNPRPYPHVYVPLGQHAATAMTLHLRVAEGSETRMLPLVARVIREVDPRLPVARLGTWREYLDGSLNSWIYRTGAKVFAAFGSIALLLAIVGVYGVKAYVVSRRTREFGIRIATGAPPRVLLWQVLREGGRITAIGVAIGVLLALGAGQILQGVLYGVNAVEPVVLIGAPLILLAASLAAAFVPALRATRIDPVVALRAD